MNYTDTLDFLFKQLPAYHRIGVAAYKNNLENTLILDEHFGHPHRKYRTIHVTGTNGKGSVSHMLASILQEAGYTTGLYTSPHLKDFRERIRINGEMIPEEEVITFVEGNKGIIENLQPSFFEMTVALAFDFFARRRVDVAVIEVGLGGRLDSTNIITPIVSVITNIGHDHMDLLGDTLEKVAGEKAGIIKIGVPVVIGETQKETMDAFISKADETGSEIYFADKEFTCSLEDGDVSKGGRKYSVTDKFTRKVHKGTTVLGGDYQVKNLVTVYGASRLMKEVMDLSDDNIRDGIKNVIVNTGLSGRWQVIGNKPLTICDTGHNKEGLEYLVRQIDRIPKKKLHMIIGFVNDKDLTAVLPLFPENAAYYFTKASVERALNENILKEMAGAYGLHGSSFPDVRSAIAAARNSASTDDMIFIGGSTFVVAECL